MRRTSGEIVSATLLEVFLALTFLVLAFARSVETERDAARTSLKNTTDSLHQVRTGQDSISGVADSLERALDSVMKFNGLYPYCAELGERPFLSILLRSPDSLAVTVEESLDGFEKGSRFTLVRGALVGRFAGIKQHSDSRKCRLKVRVQDAQEVSKVDFKRSVQAILAVFRPVGQYEDPNALHQ